MVLVLQPEFNETVTVVAWQKRETPLYVNYFELPLYDRLLWPNPGFIEVAKLLDVSLTPEQISASHRLPAKNPENLSPSIIPRFTNRDVRNKIYANQKATKTASLVNFSKPGTEKVYVNENLTRPRKKLFWLTKQKAKKIGFKYFWTPNGNILVKKTDQAEVIAIKNEKDLDLMVNEDTANNS